MEGHDVPFLIYGAGATPAEGGCIMQVVDWINRNVWSDDPICVLPELRDAAIYVNDTVASETRQRLLDLVPRLMNTEFPGYIAWRDKRTVDEITPQETLLRNSCRDAIQQRWRTLHGLGFKDDESMIDALVECLDLYDEITGRPARTEKVDFSGVCAAMNA